MCEAESSASLNAEGLRKAVKKRDKKGDARGEAKDTVLSIASGEDDARDETPLSIALLPQLYCAAFITGIELLDAAADTLRESLGHADPNPGDSLRESIGAGRIILRL